MRNKFIFGILLTLLFTNILTLALWLWSPQSKNTSEGFSVDINPDAPVAKVNDTKITYQQWLTYLENKYGKKALKEMINKDVTNQLADQENLSINEGVVQLELSLLATMEGILTEEAIDQKEQRLEEEVTNRLYLEELVTQDILVSEEEIESYYNQYSEQYHFSPSTQLSHITVEDQATAQKIISELDGGTSFSTLARQYTTDEETRDTGGYLGYFTSSSSYLPSGYFEYAQEMNEHTYSEPIQTEDGVAIIYLHRYLPEVDLSYDQLHAHIRREIALEKMEDVPQATSLWNQLEVDWVYKNK